MYDALAQAEHNENACQYLNQSKKDYQDWVITSACYSALHYTEHRLFPLKETLVSKEYTFKDFDQYFATGPLSGGRHEVRIKLVDRKIPKVSAQYQWLYNTCMTARYSDYQYDQSIADTAINYLMEIKDGCTD